MDESQTIRVSVEEAATLLSIEKDSVKKRIQRGKLRSEKDASGQLWVYLDERRVPLTASFAASHQPPKPRRPLPSDLHFVLSVVVKQGTTIF